MTFVSPVFSLFLAALAAATIRSETGDNANDDEEVVADAFLPVVPVDAKAMVPPTRAHVKPAATVRPGSSKPAIADKAVDVVVVVRETPDGAKAQISSVWRPILTTTMTTMTILNKSRE